MAYEWLVTRPGSPRSVAASPVLPQVIATLPAGLGPQAVRVNPATGYAYVANSGSNNVTVLSDTRLITPLPVGSSPQAIGVNPITGYIYVANMGSNNMTV